MNRSRLIVGWVIALAALAIFAIGCGADSGGDKTVTVEKPAAEAPPVEEDPAEPSEKPTKKKKRRATTGGSGGGSIAVPDVAGKDHQLAQDTMQGEGLYILNEKDCSGQGRALVLDRNWTVQSQKPPAGSKVSEDQEITLCSVKDGE